MKINRPASEASVSSVLLLTAMDLYRPRKAYKIFNHSQCIIYVRTNLRAVLWLYDDLPLQGAGVMNLLEIAIGLDKMSLLRVAQLLDWQAAPTIQQNAPPFVLITATDACTVFRGLVTLGEEHGIATFEDVTDNLDPECGTMVAANQDLLTKGAA